VHASVNKFGSQGDVNISTNRRQSSRGRLDYTYLLTKSCGVSHCIYVQWSKMSISASCRAWSAAEATSTCRFMTKMNESHILRRPVHRWGRSHHHAHDHGYRGT
jgi:hypothetical protein